MTEFEYLTECLRNWTMKTCIGNQEAYDNLWEEIDHQLKILKEIVTVAHTWKQREGYYKIQQLTKELNKNDRNNRN